MRAHASDLAREPRSDDVVGVVGEDRRDQPTELLGRVLTVGIAEGDRNRIEFEGSRQAEAHRGAEPESGRRDDDRPGRGRPFGSRVVRPVVHHEAANRVARYLVRDPPDHCTDRDFLVAGGEEEHDRLHAAQPNFGQVALTSATREHGPMLWRTTVPILVGALVLVPLAGCGDGGGDELVIYSGRNKELVGSLLDDFSEETGIPIAVRYGDSADLAVLIDTEGDQSPADVFLSQSPGAIGFIDGEGRLVGLPADVLDQVPEHFRASDGDWVGLSGRVRVIVYNADETDESDVPDSVFDLTTPEYEGRVGLAPSNGSFQDFVTVMRSMRGDDETLEWLTAMRENGVRTYENNIAIREAVARGEIDFGLVNHYYNEQAKAEDPDTPTENHFLDGDDPGAAILTTAVGVLDTAGGQSENAERFAAFLLTREAQEYFASETFEYPLAAGVEPASDLPALDSLATPEIDLSALGGGLQRTRELIRDSGLERA